MCQTNPHAQNIRVWMFWGKSVSRFVAKVPNWVFLMFFRGWDPAIWANREADLLLTSQGSCQRSTGVLVGTPVTGRRCQKELPFFWRRIHACLPHKPTCRVSWYASWCRLDLRFLPRPLHHSRKIYIYIIYTYVIRTSLLYTPEKSRKGRRSTPPTYSSQKVLSHLHVFAPRVSQSSIQMSTGL